MTLPRSRSIARTLRGTDAWETYLELTRGEPGAPEGHPLYSKRDEETGQFVKPINRDDVTVNGDSPAIIPLSPDVPRPRKRDYSREAPTGNSTSYKLRRLEKKRPDLLERVRSGELTPNTAAIAAGFQKPTITLPLDPDAAAPLLIRHFQGNALTALIRGLANWAGGAPPPNRNSFPIPHWSPRQLDASDDLQPVPT